MDIIIYVGISQSIFAAILMLTKKGATISDKILTGWLFLLAIEFLSCAFDLIYFESSLLSSVFLLINPAFYLYIKSLISKDFKLRYIHLLHLLPYLLFEITTYFIQEPFSMHFLTPGYPNYWFSLAFSIANILSCLFYNIFSIILVAIHRINLKNEFSTIESYKKIAWLLFVLIFYVVYCSAALLIGVIALYFDFLSELPSIFTYSVMLILAYIFGFYGLRQKRIYDPEIIDPIATFEKKSKYKSSILTTADKTKYKEMILRHFKEDKPYLNPDFNMTLLSSYIQIPKHHITQVLNMEIGSNFFSFVNEYRIEAVKKMLLDESKPYSIEAIAYECGFNSKSSFFTVFKSLTGITPFQYKTKYLNMEANEE